MKGVNCGIVRLWKGGGKRGDRMYMGHEVGEEELRKCVVVAVYFMSYHGNLCCCTILKINSDSFHKKKCK